MVSASQKKPQTVQHNQNKGQESLPSLKFVRWTEQQNKKYLQFLNENEQYLNSELNRRVYKVFSKMSTQYGLQRTAQQCRTHHQKLIARHRTIPNIKKALQRKISRKNQMNGCHIKEKNNIQKMPKVKEQGEDSRSHLGQNIETFDEDQWRSYFSF